MSAMREEGSRVCAGAQTDKRTTPLAKLDLRLNGKAPPSIGYRMKINLHSHFKYRGSLSKHFFPSLPLVFMLSTLFSGKFGGINAGTPSINFPRNIFNFIKSFRPTAFSLTSCLRSGSVMRTKRPHGMYQGLQICFEL